MKIASIAVVVLSLMVQIEAIGFCREDNVCMDEPTKTGQICKCWSSCSAVTDARRCDHVSPEYTGYDKEDIGGSDVACNYLPFVKNARDLCVWYYDPDLQPQTNSLPATFFRANYD